MSGGRLRIRFFGAGELTPAAEGFDAAGQGIVACNHAGSPFSTGKSFAAQDTTAVWFGLNFQGLDGWMDDGGGLDLRRGVYDRSSPVPHLCGNTGVQMTGRFRRPIEKVEDLRGLPAPAAGMRPRPPPSSR